MTRRRAVHSLDRVIEELTSVATDSGAQREDAGFLVWRYITGRLCEGKVDDARLDAWFGFDKPELRAAWQLFGRLAEDRLEDILAKLDPDGFAFDTLELGAAFERTAGLRLQGTAKRDAGMYYTPGPLADFAVEQTLTALGRGDRRPSRWRVLDPAGGAGAFAVAVVEQVADLLAREEGFALDAAREHVLVNAVFLVDSDPLAVAVARVLLVARFGSATTDLDTLERHVVWGDALVGGPDPLSGSDDSGGVRWVEVFPRIFEDGGFDAVIGNPPWGTIKPAVREFAATVDPALLRMEGSAMRAALAESAGPSEFARAGDLRAYAAHLRAAGYEAQGGGDTEFYRYFVELAHGLVRPGGALGLLVPSALQRASGAAPLRRLLLETGSVDLWLDFLNTRSIFDIHSMFRFSLIIWRRSGRPGIRRARFGLTSVADARLALTEEPMALSRDYLSAVSPSRLTIPDVRSKEQADLYARLHASQPALGEEVAGAWEVRFRREVDMTNDLRHFVTTDRALREGAVPLASGSWTHPELGEMLPVFEGRMVHQFDAAAKAHVEGHGRSARWELLGPEAKRIQPRYLLVAAEAKRRGVRRTVRAAFCDVTGHANERTVLAALVPDVAVCGNKVPTCEFSRNDADVALLWTCVANSFVIDWLARRRVSTTLNFFHWLEMPFPRLDPSSAEGRRLVKAGKVLSVDPGRPWTTTLEDRASFRVQIDVDVALLFGLDLRDAVVIFQDFPLLDRGAPSGHHTVTRDQVLAALAAATGCSDVGLAELGLNGDIGPDRLADRLHWHSEAGAVSYVPGERAATLGRSA